MEPNTQNTPESNTVVRAQNTNNTVSFLALGVAVAALVLAWVVYNSQTGDDFKSTLEVDRAQLNEKVDDAAQKTESLTREGAGAVMEKAGEALEATGEATQEAGTDIKAEGQAMPR